MENWGAWAAHREDPEAVLKHGGTEGRTRTLALRPPQPRRPETAGASGAWTGLLQEPKPNPVAPPSPARVPHTHRTHDTGPRYVG